MTHELLDDYMADMLGTPSPAESPRPVAPSVARTPEPPATDVEPVAEPVAAVAAPPSLLDDLLAEFDAEVGATTNTPPPSQPEPKAAASSLMDDLLAEFDAEVGQSAPEKVAEQAAAPGAGSLMDDLLAEFDAEVGTAPATTEPPSTANTQPSASNPASAAAPAAPPQTPAPGAPTAITEKRGHGRRRAEDVVARWLRFMIGEQSYAVEVLKVQEVMRPPEVLRLRGAEPSLLGVMNLRGQIVPVIDLGRRLMVDEISIDALSRVVVLESDGDALGILVSSVAEVMAISEAQIEHPNNLQCGSSCPSLTGVCRQNGQLTILLDAKRLLQ